MNKKNIILISVFSVVVILTAISFSKYVIDQKDIRYFESTAFYFNTNLIDNKETSSYKIENWDGKTEKKIEFDVKNYLNNYLKTNENIIYKLKVELISGDSSEITLNIKDAGNNIISQDTQLILNGNGYNENNFYISITNNKVLDKAKTYNLRLTMESIDPYVKQLVTDIKLNVSNVGDYIYEIVESKTGEYKMLKLQINNNIKDITITYDDQNLLLDKSNKFVNDLNITSNSFTISKNNLESNKTYEIGFIKINGTDGQITVE